MQIARALFALVAAIGVASCSSGVQAPLAAAQSQWPMYQYAPDNNAVFKSPVIPRDWAYQAGGKINGGLALAGNMLLFTTFSHRLIAVDVRSGRELWHAPLANIAMSTPIVAGGTVYAGTGRNGFLHRNLLQKLRFHKEDVWGVPGGDEIAAFNLRTGARRWTFRTVGEDMPSAVYVGGRLIFSNGDWHAYALRADTGKLLWSTDVGGVTTMSNAVVAGDVVVFSICSGRLSGTATVALDPASGQLLWRSPFGHCDASPSYANGKVFVDSTAPGDMELHKKMVVAALDAHTGKPVWVYRGAEQGLWSIVASEEVAVAGAYANGTYYQPAPLLDELIAFDGTSGKIRWRFHTSGPAKMSPVVADGRVYIGDVAGMLYTLDDRSGRLLEIREFKQPFSTSPPIVVGNRLVIVNGTFVDAIPLTGRPVLAQGIGWGIVSAGSRALTSASKMPR